MIQESKRFKFSSNQENIQSFFQSIPNTLTLDKSIFTLPSISSFSQF